MRGTHSPSHLLSWLQTPGVVFSITDTVNSENTNATCEPLLCSESCCSRGRKGHAEASGPLWGFHRALRPDVALRPWKARTAVRKRAAFKVCFL